MRKLLFLFGLLLPTIVLSQEMLNSIPIELKGDRDVFQIIDDARKQTVLFLSDKKKVTALLLDEKMLIADSVSAVRPEKKFKDIIGYNGDKSNPVLFWASSNHKEIYVQSYDFTSHKIDGSSFEIPLDGEEFLQYFSEGGKFYMLTTVLKSSVLKLYTFKKDGTDVKPIDLSGLKILNANSKTENFSTSLKNGLKKANGLFDIGFKMSFKLEKIEPGIFTPLTESSEKIKCYTNPESIIITSDENTQFTQFIEINLESGKTELKVFNQKPIAGDDVNSNSFLIDKKLFQIVLNSEQLYLTVTDLAGNAISEYSALASEPIGFKNSDVIRQSSATGSKRVLEKTSQFLRKVNNDKCGIAGYKINGNYLLTIGTVSEERAAMGSGFGVPMGGFGAGATRFNMNFSVVYFNNASNYFDSYANRKVVYLNSLFNPEAKHIQGDVPELAFDKMKKFTERFYDLKAQTVYRSNGDYYFGYYNMMTKQYVIRQFTE